MKKTNLSWHAVHCKPNQELKAIKNLKNQKFEVFSPFFQHNTKNGVSEKSYKEFLFPSYIFVSINLDKFDWLKINNTLGVKKILSFGSLPAKIEDKFIEKIKKFCDLEGLLNKKFFTFKPNEKIIITDGPFKNIFGEIISIHGDNRVKILLDCINSYKKIVLNKSYILPR